jgi:hypothetical protein
MLTQQDTMTSAEDPTPLSPVTVREYLTSIYHPDMDYVDGSLEERNMGEKEHGKLQARIWLLLNNAGMNAFIETRLRISPLATGSRISARMNRSPTKPFSLRRRSYGWKSFLPKTG